MIDRAGAGRLGGSVTSEKKAVAARENGKRGGRPCLGSVVEPKQKPKLKPKREAKAVEVRVVAENRKLCRWPNCVQSVAGDSPFCALHSQ